MSKFNHRLGNYDTKREKSVSRALNQIGTYFGKRSLSKEGANEKSSMNADL